MLAGFLGRATIIDGAALSLIWPAAGVATLWIGTGNRSTWVNDFLALALATFAVNALTGSPPAASLVFVVTNVIQVVAFLVLLRRWLPDLWGFGGTAPLLRLADLGRLTLAALLGSLLGASVGALGRTLVVGQTDLSSFIVWWGRNGVAVIVIVTLGILIGQPLSGTGSARTRIARIRAALRPRSWVHLLEGAALVGGSAGLFVLMFLDETGHPLAFLVLVMSVWAGIRFGPLTVTLHGIAMGATGVGFTLAGIGPFAVIEDPYYRALVAQTFVAMAVLTGLALAFSRAERDQANRDLLRERRAADDRARMLDAVLESMTEGILVVEEGGRILVRNRAARAFAELIGEPTDQIQPAENYGLQHSNGLPVTDEELPAVRALAGETVPPEDLHLRTEAAPEGRVLEVAARPLDSEDPDAPRRAMVNTRDVTVDREHRDTLASFAGVVAHDLSNPLSRIDGWAEALADEFEHGDVPPVVGQAMLTRIQAASEHMREFIADLMSYTIARDQSLHLGPVDLTAEARSLAELRTDAPSARSAPQVDVQEGLALWADRGLVRQLLDNLIGNAVKYVAPGVAPRISVTGRPLAEWLEIRVRDNGIGIPEYQREEIFESFHQAHGDGFGGTGLGLTICRRIVERHGGSIRVEAAPEGTGSTFVLVLPALVRTAAAAPVAAPHLV